MLSLCGNDTLELSLSSGKQWVRCERNMNHNKDISETLVKCRNYAEMLTVCSCCFHFYTQFSLHRAALAEGYCISVLASKKLVRKVAVFLCFFF